MTLLISGSLSSENAYNVLSILETPLSLLLKVLNGVFQIILFEILFHKIKDCTLVLNILHAVQYGPIVLQQEKMLRVQRI